MKSSLTRRDFLKYAGVTSVGTAAMLALASCGTKENTDTPDTPTPDATEEKDAAQKLIDENKDIVGGESSGDGEEEVVKSDYIRPSLIVGGSDPGSIPPYSPNMDGRIVLWEMYELLFEQASFGAEMSPVLCDKSKGEFGGYDHEAGSSKYTFYIYDYIEDAKGNHITSADVLFCIDNFFAQGGVVKKWVGATAPDEYSIEFEFTQELEEVGELDGDINGFFIYSQAEYEKSSDGFVMSGVGTGRYELVDFIAGNSISLKRRDTYWQKDESLIAPNQQANVQELRIDFISETAQKVIALQTGAVDMVEALDTQYVDEFRDDDRYQVFAYKDNLTWYLCFNCSSDSACHDLNMRLAIANAVDVDGILTALGDAWGARAYTMGNDNFGDYNPEWETWDNYNTKHGAGDAAQIKSWLDAAGYGGETLTFLSATGSDAEKILTIIQAQLLAFGINMKINQLDSAALSVERADSTKWDVYMDRAASKGFIVSIWGGDLLNREASSTGNTRGWVEDDTLEELTSTCLKVSGHTKENIDACWQHVAENCYVMGLMSVYSNMILPADLKTLIRNGKKWMIHTACVYEDPNA